MNTRIIWIDWAKAMAVWGVVICHIPQQPESFFIRYIQGMVIVVFFFISGYLKKDRGSQRANWQKYWQSLLLPYFIYNALLYPYWWLKFYLSHGTAPTLLQALKPVFGTLLLQHENAWCEPLDGPLWYLPAILIMHLTVDLCRRSRHQHTILATLCLLSVVLYAANKYWYFAPNLTPMGLMRNLPYYYLGYLMGRRQRCLQPRPRLDAACCIVGLLLSVLLFHIHLHSFYAGHHLLQIALYYPANIAFLTFVLGLSRLLDASLNSKYSPLILKYSPFILKYSPLILKNAARFKQNEPCFKKISPRVNAIVTNLSEGTLVVVGFHIVLVTAANTVRSTLFDIPHTAAYTELQAILTALVIVALLYPVIRIAQHQFPLLIGRNG